MDGYDEKNTSPRGWYFCSKTAGKILAAQKAGEPRVTLSLDLNISEQAWEIREDCLVPGPLPGSTEKGEATLRIPDLVVAQRSPGKVFFHDGVSLRPVEVRADGYYKLVPTDSVPTLEINGIKMHRSKDIDPLEDARLKTELAVRPDDIVLDTCGGLGYSAVFAVKAGAKKVVSTERSSAVLKIRQYNPWTRAGAFDWLTEDAAARVHLAHADIVRHIESLADQTFDAVVHDPPRFCSATGDLYGKVFYGHLCRVMKDGGRLFHYTGSPKRIKNGNRFVANAAKRLEQAGFAKVVFNDRLQGLSAVKAAPRMY